MCVSFPVRASNHNVCAALSVSGRPDNVSDRVQVLVAELSAAAKRISARIGGSYDVTEYL